MSTNKWCVIALCASLGLAACSRGSENNADNSNNSSTQQDMKPASMEDMKVEPDQAPEVDMRAEEDLGGEGEDMGAAQGGVPEGCNPVAYELDCLFPYPSNHFLVDDEQTISGKRVQLTEAAQLKTKSGRPFDFMNVHPVDGFSHHQPIMTRFGVVIDDDSFTFHDEDIAQTTMPTSTTLLIKASTGELVAHWAEMDLSVMDPEQQVFTVRALKNLEPETRYIVAFQGLTAVGADAPLDAPKGFAQLRDGSTDADPTLAKLSERYEAEIFPVLKDIGVERSALQLAWDFTTQSVESQTRDLLAMRNDLLAKLAQTPPAVTVNKVIEDHNDNIALRLEGTITVPLYLAEDKLFPDLSRDEQGEIVANGTHEVPFTLQVPYSAIPDAEDFEPARLMQYGHGFFGLREEINYGFMRGYSNEQKYVTASVNWRGMSEDELAKLPTEMLQRPETSLKYLNGVHQGIMDFIALSHALETTFTELDELERFGKLLYDPEHLYYYGISQGHILGTAFLALSPHVDRAVIAVGGAPFSFMMSRSRNFDAFIALLKALMGSELDVQRFVTLCQHSFDRIDPSTWSPYLIDNKFDGVPEDREILVQLGRWDHSVPTLAGYIVSRNYGIPLLEPTSVAPYGFETVTAPHDGSALVIVDYPLEDPPGYYAQLPTTAQNEVIENELNVHEAVRRSDKIKQQIDAFFQPDGTIQNFCDGGCDPE